MKLVVAIWKTTVAKLMTIARDNSVIDYRYFYK